MSFFSACDELSPPVKLLIEAQFARWRDQGPFGQVVRNIEAESALPVATFKSLLDAFGKQLDAGIPPEEAWTSACRLECHRFHGAILPANIRPDVVGRAMVVASYAGLVAQASDGNLTRAQAAALLQKYAGQTSVPAYVQRSLRRTPVGGHIVWSTFNQSEPTKDPFDYLSRRTVDIRTALGLGHVAEGETFVLIAYRPLREGNVEPLYRPTIAEAELHIYFRPHHDSSSPYGYTEPLVPNNRVIPPQPEVIHRQILGEGLLIPHRFSIP